MYIYIYLFYVNSMMYDVYCIYFILLPICMSILITVYQANTIYISIHSTIIFDMIYVPNCTKPIRYYISKIYMQS